MALRQEVSADGILPFISQPDQWSFLKIGIDATTPFSFEIVEMGASLPADVASLVTASSACLLLFKLADSVGFGQPLFLLVAFSGPESTIRDRMKFSSSMASLKNAVSSVLIQLETRQTDDPQDLGLMVQSLMSPQLPSTLPEDQHSNEDHPSHRSHHHHHSSSSSSSHHRDRQSIHASGLHVETEAEMQRRAVAIAERTAAAEATQSGPLAVAATLDPAIAKESVTFPAYFQLGPGGSTTVGLAAERPVDTPAFALLESRIFIYYCPDNAPVRAKMVYSTVKSSVASALAEVFGPICRTEQICSWEEGEDITMALSPGRSGADDAAPAGERDAGDSAGASAGMAKFKRPSRPGRGPAKLH